jgi:fimbrial isopeptide formation D2 family protein
LVLFVVFLDLFGILEEGNVMLKKLGAVVASAGLLGVSTIAVSTALSGTASASPVSSPTPVALNLSSLINLSPPVVNPQTTAFEQTVVDQQGNMWTDSVQNGLLVENAAASPHSAVGYINLTNYINMTGSGFYDQVAIGNVIFTVQQGSTSCPVIATNVAPTNLAPTPSAPFELSLKTPPVCVTAPAGYSFSGQSSYTVWQSNGSLYFTTIGNDAKITGANGTIWKVSPSSTVATPYAIPTRISAEITTWNGYLLIKGQGNQVFQYDLASLSNSGMNFPYITYTVPMVRAYDFADMTVVNTSNGPELWFLRKHQGELGVIPLTQNPEKPRSSYMGEYLPITNALSSSLEGLTYDPSSHSLWLVSGDVEGSHGTNFQFGFFDPSTVMPSTTTVTLTTVSPTTTPVVSTDDFAVVNGAPTYFTNQTPVNALTKTDSANGQPVVNTSFDYTITPSISATSPADGYGTYTLNDPMPTGVTATAVAAAAPTTGQMAWTCNLVSGTSTAGGSGTVNCTVNEGMTQLAPGYVFPSIVVTATANGPVGTATTNIATLSNSFVGMCAEGSQGCGTTTQVAPDVTASDSINPIASLPSNGPPTATLSKTAAQPTAPAGGTDSFAITGQVTGTVSNPMTITDPMPAGLTVNGTPTVTGSGFASAGCTSTASNVTCTFTPTAGGQSNPVLGTITVPVSVSSTATGTLTNTATLTDPGDGLQPITASATIQVTAPTVTVTSASSASSGGTTTVMVPSTHTGEPWRSTAYWWGTAIAALVGAALIMGTQLRRRGLLFVRK